MPIRTDPVLPEEDWQLRLDVPEDGSGVGTLTLDYLGLSRLVAVLALRRVRHRPHARGGRRQLAAP
jgi:hypothetical protein